MKTSRFLIGPFRAEGVNLTSSDFVDGIPSPAAALGFVGAIARDLGVTGWGHRAILVIHDLQEHRGRVRGEQNRKTGRIQPLEIAEGRTGRGVFSIVAEIPGVHGVAQVTKSFERKRFAGGAIFPANRSPLSSAVSSISSETFVDALRKIPRGYAITPAAGLEGTQIVSFGEEKSLEQIAQRLFHPEERTKPGYLVPVPAGFRILTDTYQKKPPSGSRNNDVPFAFVDSSVGLGQFISVRRREVFADIDTAFEKAGWNWACSPDGQLAMLSDFHLHAVSRN